MKHKKVTFDGIKEKLNKRFFAWGIVCTFVFATLAVAINLIIPERNPKKVFDGAELPSELVGVEEAREVSDGPVGALTYGPYVTLPAGEYKVRVHYKANSDTNTISSYSLSVSNGVFLEETNLPARKSVFVFNLSLENETPGVEVKVAYSGVGSLAVEYIEFIEQRQDVHTAQWMINILLVLLFAAFIALDYFWEKIAWKRLLPKLHLPKPQLSHKKKRTVKVEMAQGVSEERDVRELTSDPVERTGAEKKRSVKSAVLRMAVWTVVLAAVASIVNYGIPALNKEQVFDAVNLPSSLVGVGKPRTINDGGKRACLTYGPYITLAQGDYTIYVYYDTDTDENTVDVFSLDVDGKLYLSTLEKEENVHKIDLSLEETTSRVEVRTTYSGKGQLSVEKIEIIPVREDLQAVRQALLILLLALFCGCCGYYLSKLVQRDDTKTKTVIWRERLKKAIPVAVFISFTYCLAGPISLYVANSEEFWFSIWQMLPMLIVAFLSIAAIIAGALSVFRGKLFYGVLAGFFGIGIALYVEGNFLVQDYGLLNGNVIEWNAFSKWAVIDTLVWVIIPTIIVLFCTLIKKWAEKLIRYGSLFLTAVQVLALVIGVATAKDLDKSSEYLLTTKNYTVVSENENIIVFLLDAFDAKYMDDLLANHPEYKDTFADFVWYKDTAAAASPTHVAMPVILTGYRYTDPVSYNEYITKAYEYTPLYKQLAEHNYETAIYTGSRYVSRKQEGYISNICDEKPTINSQSQFLLDICKLTGFRYMPHVLKDWFLIYSGEFDELKSGNEQGESSYSGNSSKSYTMLQQPLTFESESNAFRFYHLTGAHSPWCLNENAEIVASEDTTREKQIRGCFLIIEEYMNQLREKNVYDNSTIIIMADHGNIDRQQNPLLMIKAKNSQGDFRISTAPISYMDILPTLLDILGEDWSEYGRSIFEIGETEQRERYCYRDMQGDLHRATAGTRRLVEQMTTDVAWNYDAWIETGKIYYGDAAPEKRQKYVFGTELSFLEEATGNQYAMEGLGRINDNYTITIGGYSILDIPLARKPKADVKVCMTINTDIGRNNQLIVYANDVEVFNNEDTNGTIEFTIPKELVDDNITLRLEYPVAIDKGYLTAFKLVNLKMSD